MIHWQEMLLRFGSLLEGLFCMPSGGRWVEHPSIVQTRQGVAAKHLKREMETFRKDVTSI